MPEPHQYKKPHYMTPWGHPAMQEQQVEADRGSITISGEDEDGLPGHVVLTGDEVDSLIDALTRARRQL